MADQPRRRLLRNGAGQAAGLLVALSATLAGPAAARASNDEEVQHYDARVQGYDPDVEAKGSSVALQWGMLFFLGGLCVGVMFINARRSHLD